MRVLFNILTLALAVGALAQTADWAALNKQAEDLYVKGDLKEAIRVARLAVAVASGSEQSSHSLDRLGFFEYTAGDLKEGEADLRHALELRKAAPESIEYAESANDLALLLRDAGKMPEARELATQAVAIRQRKLDSKHLNIAESLNTLASIVGLTGEYDTAIARFEEARAIHEAQTPPAEFSEEYGTLCVNLAGTYQRAGRYGKSEEMFQRGLDVLRVKPGVNHPAYSASLVAFAYLQADLGHFSEAEKLYAESGRLLREQLGEEHPVYATFLNNQSALFAALGNVAAAEPGYRKSLELKRKIYGPDALTVGASLRNLGNLMYKTNRAEGEKLFAEAVALYARNPKPPPFDFASALLGLAEAQRNRGALAAARETLARASQVIEAGLSVKHPLFAAVLSESGLVHQAAREYADAEKQIQAAAAIVEETHGPMHPDLARYLQRLASAYSDAGDFQAAEPLYRRSMAIGDRALAEMLTIGSQRNKSAVLANLEDPVPALLAFQERAGLAQARALALEAVAGRKGRTLDQVHEWGQSLKDNADAQVRARFAQWEAMIECQASFTVALGYRELRQSVVGTCALPGTEFEGRYERLLHNLRTNWTEALGKQGLDAVNALMRSADALEADLSRRIPQFASAVRSVRLEDLRARLAPDEALMEFAAFPDRDARRYGAFVLTARELQWMNLGVAAPIDRAVQDFIASANERSAALARKESRVAASAEETGRDALRMLSVRLAPVTAWLAQHNEVRRLRIAPDGMLQLAPFSAIADARGRYLIERVSIAYLSAGRDLLTDAPAPAAGPMIIALSPGPGSSSPTSPAGQVFRADVLTHLAGAEQEAREVQRRIPRAQLLGQGQATEQRVKDLHRPALLHIVGHGLVRGNQDCRGAAPGCELAGLSPGARTMSLSAIVLEEAYGRGGGSGQDGLLTALELQTLDLQGAEMLVLSQCRMADGVPSSGDGVFGMRRAAAIAGVKTFIAPLWAAGDASEQALMSRFYRELSSGRGRAEALRESQLQLLRDSRTASVFEWAPVILSGDPSPVPTGWFR